MSIITLKNGTKQMGLLCFLCNKINNKFSKKTSNKLSNNTAYILS